MSSNEDEVNDADNTHKKRRIQRACDICRRKKIRCDGGQQPDNVCSNCSTYKFECTYVESAKKRGPPKGYVEALETRVERLDKLLRRLCPDENVYNEMNKALDTNQWTIERPPAHPSPLVGESSASGSNFRGSFLDQVASAIRHVGATVPPPTDDDDDEATLMLADNLKRLELEPLDYRFFGKSSGAMLIRTALELKDDYVGGAPWGNSELSDPLRLKASMKHLRPEFWVARPWEKKVTSMESPVYTFPEPDLARDLIDLYFRYVNLYQPLLHRPTFMKWVDEEMYLKNASFAPVYLLVCAVGARWSDDPRCLLEGYDSYHSCGWKWFDQVQLIRRSILSPPTLFDLQVYVLSIQFLQGSSAPQSCWTMVGIGIRLAQDVGAHRRKANGQPNTPEDEMWRRAFWVLVSIDRAVSSSLGRPCAIQDEDFDLEMPADCDDEYWEHPDPEKRFKQPPGKPSLITAFILSLSLNQILAFSLRTIYSINKSKVLLGFIGQPWEETIVTELDSALNKWVDSIPDHLRWDPNRKDDDFFNQSVSLYTSYYHVQILIHRPFIPSPSKPSSLKFPSLAICTNAARICSHIVDIQGKRNSKPPPQTMMAVFTSAIVLLLSMWGGKRSGFTTDHNTGMADVQKCMKMLGMSEKRWHSAGRLWDIVYELAAVGDLPLPQPSPPTSNKRERNADEPISSASATDASRGATPPDQQPSVRVMASNSRLGKDPSVSADQFSVSSQSPDPHGGTPSPLQRSSGSRSRKPSQTHLHVEQAGSMPPPPPQYYALPVYSDDLGRLPIHGQLSFTPQGQTHLKTPQLPHKPTYMWPTTAPESANSGEGSSGGPSSSHASMGYPHQTGIPPHAGHFAPRYNQVAGLSPMAQGSPQGYGVDGALSAGMMFDTLSYAHSPQSQQQERQQHPQAHLYGIGPMGPAGLIPGSMQSPQGFTPSSVEGLVERQHQQQQAIGQQQTMGDVGFSEFVDNDTMAMWTNAPTGFELNEWGTYLNNVSELTQHAPGTMSTGHQQQPHLRQQ